MQVTRRDTLAIGLGAAVAAVLPLGASAAVEDAIAAFTGGVEPGGPEGITFTAPEIAENGNTVPIEVDAPGASAVMVLALGNPNPDVMTAQFGTMAGAQLVSTRIRLAGTQEVLAFAKLADGSIAKTSATVKVTIGGCGG